MRKAPSGVEPAASARPRTVQAAVAAMGASGVAALVAAISLYGQRDWLTREQEKTDKKGSAYHTANQMHHLISQQQQGALIGTIIVAVALSVLALSVYRGRYWSRWGVIAFWFLASFTGTVAGLTNVFLIGTSAPVPFKVPAFLSGALLIAAVVLVNMRPSLAFFALTKPVRPADAPARRGLFAPRTPIDRTRPATTARPPVSRAKTAVKSSAATRGEAYVQKQRSKKRAAANAESIAHGAELARNRAKASKSRRIES
jgi:hypothetical protein